MIQKGALDVAFEIYFDAMDDPDIESQPLYIDSAVVMVERTHRLAGRSKIRFEELELENHITLNGNNDYALREFFPIFTKERYCITPLANDDIVFDIRAFYHRECPKRVCFYLDCLKEASPANANESQNV